MATKITDEIIAIVQSVQHLTIADYGPTHAIFSDYNLSGHKSLYEAANDFAGWAGVIHKESVIEMRDIRPVIAEIEQVMKALDLLMTYSEADLESASDELWSNGFPIAEEQADG